MKRKVIFLAGKTGVVSLPSRWMRAYNISKGQELEMTEVLSGLLIAKPTDHAESKAQLDISGINSRLLFRYLNTLYKKGYTEIKLIYKEGIVGLDGKKENALVSIQHVCDYLIGMEIVKQGESYCVIKEVTSLKEGEFEVLLRRIFLMLLSTSKDLLAFLEKRDSEGLKNIIDFMDPNMGKLFKLCQRIISTERKYWDKLVSFALLTEKLECVGDIYSEICRDLKLNGKVELQQDTLEYFSDTNDLLERFYSLFYKYSVIELNKLHLDAKVLKGQKFTGSLVDAMVVTKLKEVNNRVREGIDDLIGVNV